MTRFGLAIVCFCLVGACGDKETPTAASGSADAKAQGSAAGAKAGADAKPARKAKTTLKGAQLKETYDSLKAVSDFSKHRDLIVEKLGKPAKEEGDMGFWFGIETGDDGKEACRKLSASPTKGNQSSSGSDADCWE